MGVGCLSVDEANRMCKISCCSGLGRNPNWSYLQHRILVTHPGYQTKGWELAAMEPDISQRRWR